MLALAQAVKIVLPWNQNEFCIATNKLLLYVLGPIHGIPGTMFSLLLQGKYDREMSLSFSFVWDIISLPLVAMNFEKTFLPFLLYQEKHTHYWKMFFTLVYGKITTKWTFCHGRIFFSHSSCLLERKFSPYHLLWVCEKEFPFFSLWECILVNNHNNKKWWWFYVKTAMYKDYWHMVFCIFLVLLMDYSWHGTSPALSKKMVVVR